MTAVVVVVAYIPSSKEDDAMGSMSPSDSITPGQAAKFTDLQVAALRKSGLPSAATQLVLETQGDQLVAYFVAEVRRRVDVISTVIRRPVKVDRKLSPQQVLDATGCKPCANAKVISTMPRGEGNEVEVIFFKVGRHLDYSDLEKEYELRGLKPCDPYSLTRVNIDDPHFAGAFPNSTQWKVGDSWHFATFRRWSDGELLVYIDRDGRGWGGYWWFAGLRK